MADSPTYVTASLTAQNTFSDSLTVRNDKLHSIAFSLEGTWAATVHLQAQRSGSSNWIDIATRTSNDAVHVSLPGSFNYRFGVKTGNYTSGTVIGVLTAEQILDGGQSAL